MLRQPLEDRCITITRAHGSVTYPANFILVAAMNPPQYGGAGARSRKRVSAPLLDRIDLSLDVQPVAVEDLQKVRAHEGAETSAEILLRVMAARERQEARFLEMRFHVNAAMDVRTLEKCCPLDSGSEELLAQAVRRLGLSARAYHRTIKVARTIADLEGAEHILQLHIAEALQYRQSIGLDD